MRTMNLLCTAAAMCLAMNAFAQNEPAKAPAAKPAAKQPDTTKKAPEAKKAGDEAPKTIDPNDPIMKAWMAYASPGQNHTFMAALEGKWEGEVTMWMTPGAAPEKSP